MKKYNNIILDTSYTLDVGYGLYFEISKNIAASISGYAMVIESNSITKLDITEKFPATDIQHVSLFQVHDRLITAMTGANVSIGRDVHLNHCSCLCKVELVLIGNEIYHIYRNS